MRFVMLLINVNIEFELKVVLDIISCMDIDLTLYSNFHTFILKLYKSSKVFFFQRVIFLHMNMRYNYVMSKRERKLFNLSGYRGMNYM